MDRPILLVAGARPNYVKAAPLLRAFAAAGLPCEWVDTGQHYDDEMAGSFIRLLMERPPDHRLCVGSGSHAETTARVLLGMEKVIRDRSPRVVVVLGDVDSTVGAALAAAKCGVPIAHVEAGLRSGDRTMPEEINRIVVDHLADVLYATEYEACRNLLKEGRGLEDVEHVGNVMVDTLERFREEIEAEEAWRALGLERGGYILATLHRPALVDSPARQEGMLVALRWLSELKPVVFPVHPRTEASLRNGTGWWRLKQFERVHLLPPQGYIPFLSLQLGAALVITDSGGVQEETTCLQVPCLTMRENTERPATVQMGTNMVVGLDPGRVVEEAEQALCVHHAYWQSRQRPTFWDGKAAGRIADNLFLRYFAGEGEGS